MINEPDNRIIPFCAMNNIHREEVEKKFAIKDNIDYPQFTQINLKDIPIIENSSLRIENILRINQSS